MVGAFDPPGGGHFDRHVHPTHQLAWTPDGVLRMGTDVGVWLLPPSRALWLPAGVPHTAGWSGSAHMCSVYFVPSSCPVGWTAPTVVGVTGLLRELMEYLARAELSEQARTRAEAVVFDALAEVPSTTLAVLVPTDDRARQVALGLRAAPADQRTLPEWGREVGASGRTLARSFVAETGLTFGRWRSHARLEAALPLLADGLPVSAVAARVGYRTTSGFVAAFRKAVGEPPARYFGSGDVAR
jgi:AraC-like DNA-binding protein